MVDSIQWMFPMHKEIFLLSLKGGVSLPEFQGKMEKIVWYSSSQPIAHDPLGGLVSDMLSIRYLHCNAK